MASKLDSKKTDLGPKFSSDRAAEEASAHKQKRALLTRTQLLCSARTVFARYGFEHARLEDIAAQAGKTRGAFYANFKNKEDVFFAIFEDDIANDQEKIRPILRALPTLKKRIHALAAYLGELGKDEERMVLSLEFKMYAIRHPRKRVRLAELHAAMRLRCALPEIFDLLPELEQSRKDRHPDAILAVGAIIDGFALNRLFDPGALSDEQFSLYLTLCAREALKGVVGRVSQSGKPAKSVK